MASILQGLQMIDSAAARRMMVDGQVRTADVTDMRLLAAMLDVPRELFVPEESAALAYLDLDAPVTETRPPRRLLKPMVLAKLIQAAEVTERDRVLDVACATGYSSALLARLAAAVFALEEDAALARQAKRTLAEIGATAVTVVTGALSSGWPAAKPYDVILLNGATEVVPERLVGQLAEGGRLVCVLGSGPAGKAMLYRRVQGDVSPRPIFDAAAPLLPGFAKPQAFVF
jgi:protein-L-isoaspartate(D-aspartate) O-methyltransferase